MTNLYVGPVDNICDAGQASTYTEELGRHCVDIVTHLAKTGSDPDLMTGGIITAVLLILGSGILFAYNHLRNKD